MELMCPAAASTGARGWEGAKTTAGFLFLGVLLMGELCTSAVVVVLSRSVCVSLQLSLGKREQGKVLPPYGSWGCARAAA